MADDTTIAGLQSHIRDLELEVVEAKRMVNRLLARKGQPPLYADTSASDGAALATIRSDTFYKKTLIGAMKDFLKMRKVGEHGPADINTIYKALVAGGFQFETDDEVNRKKTLRASLSKNSSIFHRVPGEISTFGLTEWYGIEDESAGAAKTKGKKTRRRRRETIKKGIMPPELKATATTRPPDASGDPPKHPTTMIQAVRTVLVDMNGEFTKQDVVDRIEKQFPELKASQKKESVFSMMGSLKKQLKIVTTQAGKGKEPHKYRLDVASK